MSTVETSGSQGVGISFRRPEGAWGSDNDIRKVVWGWRGTWEGARVVSGARTGAGGARAAGGCVQGGEVRTG